MKNVQALLTQYHLQITQNESPNPVWVNNYNDLRLVDACLDKDRLSRTHPEHPLQVGIVGPTQAGKSTLVNVLTDSNAAGISARAGYTVHAQGFALNLTEASLAPIGTVLEPMVRVNAGNLVSDDLNAYLLEPVTAGPDALLDAVVVWDSPDFDSIEAKGYRTAVLYTLALADVLVLTVSKDKYGDKSVWDMLALMVPLDKPIVAVINKLDECDSAAVQHSFVERFRIRFPGSAVPTLVPLPYIDNTLRFLPQQLDPLGDALAHAEHISDRSQLRPAIDQFINDNWSTWIEPAQHENRARQTWNQAVEEAINQGFSEYESRYLNDESRNDTFNRALAELLNLLEIPGIAATVQKTREVVTWPVRKLFGMGMDAIRGDVVRALPVNVERDVLISVQTHLLTTLQALAIDAQQDQPEQSRWWQALNQELRARRETIKGAFDQRALQHKADFEPRIEAAAQRLYQQLRTQPRLLNSLRAARVTTDAAAVVLAVKSGGLAPTDLLVAPAMLSVTTLLTESALGRYMATVKAELKREKGAEVRQHVFDEELGAALLKLPQTMNQSELLGLDSELEVKKHAG